MGQDVTVEQIVPDVDGWFGVMNSYASEAISNASNMANSLAHFYAPGYYSDVHFNSIIPKTVLGGVIKPTKPSISMGARVLPAPVGMVIPSLTLDAAPIYDLVSPSISFPAIPSPLLLSAPLKDFTIDLSTPFPTAPSTTLPSVPTLIGLNLPTPQSLYIPIFDQVFPTSSLSIPTIDFSFFENPYSDDLLTAVKNSLISRLQGGTGLNPVVEAAIWNRGRDREARSSLQAERALLVDRVSSGFSRPPGAVMAALEQIVQDTQSKIIDLSREIMIKQAEMEQENLKTTLQQSIALEDILMREHNNLVNRSFEVAKYTQGLSIDIFKLEVSMYNTKIEAYKSFSTAYTARVQAELAKIEIFKAQIEGEKLKGDINEQNIRIYTAQIEGVKVNVELYKDLVQAVSERFKAESIKVDIFKSEIDAYSAQVAAKAAEFNMYSDQVKAEGFKVDVFDSQVKAFTSRIQAYASSTDAKTKVLGASVDIEELKIKKYEADIDAFIKQVQADQIVFSSAVDIYKGEAELYLADIGLNKAKAELDIKDSENIIAQNKYAADVGIENAKVSLEGLKGSYMAQLEAKKAAGSIYSTLSSSALSGIHVSAAVSSQAQISLAESHSYTDK